MTMTLHNYRSRQVHEALHGVNPAVSDICIPQSLHSICGKFDKFWSMTVHNYRPRRFQITSNGENQPSSYRDMGSASLEATRLHASLGACLPTRTVTTIPLQPGGLRGKKYVKYTSTVCIHKFLPKLERPVHREH